MTIYFKGPFSIFRNEILINFARIVWRVLCKNAPKHVLILPTRSNNCFKSIFSALLCKHFHVLANCQTICVSLLTTATNIALGSFDLPHNRMFWKHCLYETSRNDVLTKIHRLLRLLWVQNSVAHFTKNVTSDWKRCLSQIFLFKLQFHSLGNPAFVLVNHSVSKGSYPCLFSY